MGYTPKDLVVKLDADHADAAATDAILATIRRVVRKADPDQPLSDLRPLSALLERETAARSVQVRVLAAFAGLSCLLAAVGLHGLLAFVVSARTREFGVRLALGAEPRQILGLVARRGLILGCAGVMAGIWIAYAGGRWVESLLAGVSPADPVTFGVAIGVAILMTLAGSFMPAWRAARINPKEAIEG